MNEKIKHYFGDKYCLSNESEPDDGTTVRIHLPVVTYSEAVERGMV